MKLKNDLNVLATGAFGHAVGSGFLHALAINLDAVVIAALAGVVTGGVLVYFLLAAFSAKKPNDPDN